MEYIDSGAFQGARIGVMTIFPCTDAHLHDHSNVQPGERSKLNSAQLIMMIPKNKNNANNVTDTSMTT